MSAFSRRGFLKTAVGGFAIAGTSLKSWAQSSEPVDALVIGSGFGGAIAALRLAQAGVRVVVLERGRRWPIRPDGDTFATFENPDGRAAWLSNIATGIDNPPKQIDRYTGVLELIRANGMEVRNGDRVLAEAAQTAEDAQVRNRATVGGSIAYADPQADLPAAILALDAAIQVKGPKGSRVIAADEFFTGPNQTALGRGEVITGVGIAKTAERSGTAYEKARHPATLRALCGIAVSVAVSSGGAIASARVAVTGAADRAARLKGVEGALVNQQPTAETLAAASAVAGEGLTFLDDHWAAADYRQHLTRVLTKRALKRALERAGVGDRSRKLSAGGDQ